MFCAKKVTKLPDLTVLTYEVYRTVSGVFQNTKILTPHPPFHPMSVFSPSRGGTHSPGGEGVGGGQYFGRRQTLDWPLTVYSLYVLTLLMERQTTPIKSTPPFYPYAFILLILLLL